MLTISETELIRLQKNLLEYQRVYTKLTVPEILDKKGTDLRIQLWDLFWQHKFGGPGKKKGSIAFQELKRRTKSGIGTRVRNTVLEGKWARFAPAVTKAGKPLSAWQKLVFQETQRRQSGIGILALPFLSRRFRSNNAQGRYLVENNSKTLGTLVRITKEATSYTIEGFAPALDEIANRYGIADEAIRKVNVDIEKYLARKEVEARAKVFQMAA